MRVFTLIDRYLPGYKHGGPIRTVANMVATMPRAYQFWIFTRDRERGDAAPYPGVRRDAWNDVAGARVFYASPGADGRLGRELRRATPDLLYSNSLFSRLNVRLLLARRAALVPPLPFVLAPRGELSPGALRLKPGRKAVFLRLAAATGLLEGVVWQASTALERAEIAAALGAIGLTRPAIRVAADPVVAPAAAAPITPKRSGAARLTFLSRLDRKKNLGFAIDALRDVRGDVELEVYGPRDDPGCWAEWQRLAARLPPRVRVAFRGPVPHPRVAGVLAAHHFFVLPTLGENFGHAVAEALAAGCPPLLSDRTPWRDLEAQGAGWDLPLSRPRWVEALQRCVDMGADEHAAMSARARALAARSNGLAAAIDEAAALFDAALASGRGGAGGPRDDWPALASPSVNRTEAR